MATPGRLSRMLSYHGRFARRRPLIAALARCLTSVGWPRYLLSAGVVAGATALMLLAPHRLGVLNVTLLYLLVSFALALLGGAGPAALAAVLSFLAFDFFFIPPYHQLGVARGDLVLALFVYLGVSVITGQLVARGRDRTEIARREQRRTLLLYELNAALIGDVSLDAILSRIVSRVVEVYGAARCRMLLPVDDGALVVQAAYPPDVGIGIDRQHLALANWALAHRLPAGSGQGGVRVRPPHGPTAPPPRAAPRRRPDVLYLPIATAQRAIGILEVEGKPGGGRFSAEDERLLTTFANQAALALERARLNSEEARAAVLAQSDELKTALLAAVSHELRTPLATIKAAVTSLLDPSVTWDADARAEFLQAIDEETDRLSLMVGNLLDLSRIEGGALRPNKQWYDAAELVADVIIRTTSRYPARLIETEIPPDLPLVQLDYVEIAQVLMNLVENAIKYSPATTPIVIAARSVPAAIEFSVRDGGPGISPARLPHIFEPFYRGDESGRVVGAGIGLAISKGLVEAHGGRIWAESRAGEGTTLRFTLPLTEPTA